MSPQVHRPSPVVNQDEVATGSIKLVKVEKHCFTGNGVSTSERREPPQPKVEQKSANARANQVHYHTRQ